ncbi:MAG: DNA methylase [Tenericutes bacterium ADurb.Bin087]|nr:MAG: DNA methylase [Tenericutes bacterium ADurb.Bin087]
MSTSRKEIDYALVEEKRPPLYTSMKYWGKKPHNIWNEYIRTYTSKNGFYLDPFTGSAMSAFESFKAGRKCFAFDLNPLSSFIIEVVCSDFDQKKYNETAARIIKEIENDNQYANLFCYRNNCVLHNVKWNGNNIYEVCFVRSDGYRFCDKPNEMDFDSLKTQIDFSGLLYPNKEFRNAISFSATFLKTIGKTYDCLYTNRNLYVLSLLFKKICALSDEIIKKQLLFAFIQTVHLSTKMCVPRSKSAKRDFSTSWGRAAFLSSKKQMEMNPLLLFKNSCWGKQSVESVLLDAKKCFKRKPRIANINETSFNNLSDVDIWYGVVGINSLANYIPSETLDFVLTDPPYGGLIQYLDLSSIWLTWLEIYDKKYSPNYDAEITVNNEKTYDDFSNDFAKALLQIRKALKKDGKLVLTFNNKNLLVWNSFLKAISSAGFSIEKIIHQQNKRSGESNVDDPTGVSASDYYIRCIKRQNLIKTLSAKDTEKVVLETLKEIIIERNEPTPYQVLFNAFLCKISVLGIDLGTMDIDFDKFLNNHKDVVFVVATNDLNRAGDYWWIKGKKFNKNSKKTLSNRVRIYLEELFESKRKYTREDLFSLIFKKFPNEMSPDIESLNALIKEIAYIKNDLWIRRGN